MREEPLDIVLTRIEAEIRAAPYSPPAILQRQFDRGSALDRELESYVRATPPGHGHYYQFLALLVRKLRPRCVLELGSFYGISTLMLYSELPPDGLLTSVDLIDDQRYIPPDVRRDPRLRLVLGDALDLNIYGEEIPIDIDLLFSDTIHTYDQIAAEFDIYRHLLSDGAIVLVDDIRLADKWRFFEELRYPKWDLTELCHRNGFGLFQYSAESGLTPTTRIRRAALASAAVWHRRCSRAERELGQRALEASRRPLTRLVTLMRRAARPLRAALVSARRATGRDVPP